MIILVKIYKLLFLYSFYPYKKGEEKSAAVENFVYCLIKFASVPRQSHFITVS